MKRYAKTAKLCNLEIVETADFPKTFSLIHDSNMTKLCKTEEEAIQTVEWYKANENRYDSPTYRLSDDKKYYVVYNKSTGKILKSINYSPVKFDSMLFNNLISLPL